MKYSMTCDQGHEPETFTVEAENDDEAMTKMMEASKPHMMEKHPEMANKSEDEQKQMIMGMWKKEEGGGEAGAPAM